MAHTPVLLKEVLKYLDPKPGNFIIDGTVDGGGHSAEIFERILPDGKLLGIDWDPEFLGKATLVISAKLKNQKSKLKNLILINGNYADLSEIIKSKNLGKADGLLLDLGFSSWQMESSGRGFSFGKSEPLLMTFDPKRKPAKEVLKEIDEKELAKIIFDLSGEKYARRIAQAIKERGAIKPIETSSELREAIESAVPKNYERGRISPATRTFQALRIYVNDELGNLEKILDGLEKIVKPGGRVVIISFHSLEDGLVKRHLREVAKEGRAEILTKKPITPSEEEIKANPKSRSAKLRAAIIKK
jgi:16S rRNA (cytosine1402-N4)-methyltransferase